MNLKEEILVCVDHRLKGIIPDFMARQRENISAMRSAYNQHNYSELTRLGHKMRGTCGGYGLVVLGELAEQVENAATHQDDTHLSANIESLEKYISRVKIEYGNIWGDDL